MILNNNKSDIEVIGNVSSNKVGIDSKNLDIITTLLSSTLYSNPFKSFIRETVSNAYDSCVEAGTTDKPILFTYDKSDIDNSYTISIRDFGTGLSPKRFKDIYCNIGSSTKRNSNDYIGGFGLGRFSALACSNTVEITSYYNGKVYYYLMTKDGNKISIMSVGTDTTDEPNGLKVSINFTREMYYLDNNIEPLVFIPNLYVVNNKLVSYNNDIKIKKFKYFSVCNKNIHSKLLIGNILYDASNTKIDNDKYLINNSGINFNFNIGEITLTPNREAIVYTEETINIINDRIKAAFKELHGLALKKFKSNYDNIIDYIEVVANKKYYNPLTDEITNLTGFCLTNLHKYIKYNGKYLDGKTVITLRNLIDKSVPKVLGYIYDNKFRSTNLIYYSYNNVKYDKFLIVDRDITNDRLCKKYLCKNYPDYIVAEMPKLDEFTDYYKFYTISLDPELAKTVIKSLYDAYVSKVKYFDFNNDDYKKFIEYNKPVHNSNIIIYPSWLYWDSNSIYFNDIPSVLEYLKDKKIVLHDCGGIVSKLSECAGYKFVRTSKTNYKKIIKQKTDNILLLDGLYNDTKVKEFKAISDYLVHNKHEEYTDGVFSKLLNESDSKLYNKIVDIKDKLSNFSLSSDLDILPIKSDAQTEKDLKYIRSIYDKYLKVIKEYDIHTYDTNFKAKCVCILFDKLNIYEPSTKMLDECKSNKFINFLLKWHK